MAFNPVKVNWKSDHKTTILLYLFSIIYTTPKPTISFCKNCKTSTKILLRLKKITCRRKSKLCSILVSISDWFYWGTTSLSFIRSQELEPSIYANLGLWVNVLSVIYPLPAMHSLLVTINRSLNSEPLYCQCHLP